MCREPREDFQAKPGRCFSPATTSGSSFLVGWEVFECLQCFALQYLDAKAMQCCRS